MSKKSDIGFRLYASATIGIIGLALVGNAVVSFNNACKNVIKNPEKASSLESLVCNSEPSNGRPLSP